MENINWTALLSAVLTILGYLAAAWAKRSENKARAKVKEIEGKSSQIDSNRDAIALLERSNQYLFEQLKIMQEERDEDKERIAQLEDARIKNTERIIQLEGIVLNGQSRVTQLESELAIVQVENEKTKIQLAEVRAENEETKIQLSAQLVINEELLRENDSLRGNEIGTARRRITGPLSNPAIDAPLTPSSSQSREIMDKINNNRQ